MKTTTSVSPLLLTKMRRHNKKGRISCLTFAAHVASSACLSVMLLVAIFGKNSGRMGAPMTIRRAQVFHTRTADFGHVQKQSFSNSFRAGFKPVVEVPRGFGMDMRSLQVLRPNADEPTSMKAGGFNTAGEAPFEIRGFSLGNAILGIGSLILAASFSTFFKGDASGGSGIGFVYGVPIMLIGFALKYAELEPVPLISDMEASSIFEAKASENLKKMKNDVTRHRYGDEAHMDTALKALGLWVPGKAPPELIRIKEQAQAGEMAMTLYFDAKGTPLEMWTDPLMKLRLEKFFGPGISAAVEPMDSEDKEIITVTFRSGATEGQEVKNEVKQVDDGSVISVNLAEKPLGAVISEADTLVKSVNAKAESLGIKPGMRIQAINGYKVTKLNWLQAYKVLDPPLVIDFWVPEELREPVAKANAEAL